MAANWRAKGRKKTPARRCGLDWPRKARFRSVFVAHLRSFRRQIIAFVVSNRMRAISVVTFARYVRAQLPFPVQLWVVGCRLKVAKLAVLADLGLRDDE